MKTHNAYAKPKAQISCAVTAQLISAMDSKIHLLLKSKKNFQASRLLLWLYRLVCVGPSLKLKLLVFSPEGSHAFPNRGMLHNICFKYINIDIVFVCYFNEEFLIFIYFDLWHSIPISSHCHVGTMCPFYGASSHHYRMS